MKPTPIHIIVARLKPLPLQEEVRERIDYDQETGTMAWRKSPLNYCAGRPISLRSGGDGYLRVWWVGFGSIKAHHLAWIHAHGAYDREKFLIDHANGVRNDNRLRNLRLATAAQNTVNGKLRRDNSTGVKGVRLTSWGKFNARIKINGREKSLGCFDTLEQAAAVRQAAAFKHHGEFSRG